MPGGASTRAAAAGAKGLYLCKTFLRQGGQLTREMGAPTSEDLVAAAELRNDLVAAVHLLHPVVLPAAAAEPAGLANLHTSIFIVQLRLLASSSRLVARPLVASLSNILVSLSAVLRADDQRVGLRTEAEMSHRGAGRGTWPAALESALFRSALGVAGSDVVDRPSSDPTLPADT